MAESEPIVDNPWDDPSFVATFEVDVKAETRGELDPGLSRDEFESRYAQYLQRH